MAPAIALARPARARGARCPSSDVDRRLRRPRAAALQTLGFALMAVAILRGTVHPNQFSWLIWSVVASLAAASSWQTGATGPLAGAV